MENEFLFDIAEAFFKEKNVGHREWNFRMFWYGEFIPEEKLNSARVNFAHYIPSEEKPILLMSDDIFNPLKNGFLVTNTHLYYRLKKSYTKPPQTNVIPIVNIQNIDIRYKLFGAWLLINHQKEALISSFGKGSTEYESKPLIELMQIFVTELQKIT